jgi:hypothetical protein
MQMNSDVWVIDSGASNHMTGDKRLFKTYTMLNVPRKVFSASSSTSLTVLGEGEVVLEIWNESRYQRVGLKGCLHVQGISINLFSVPASESKGANISITKTGCILTMNGQKIGVGTKVGRLYHLKTREESSLWASDELKHRRMGHSSTPECEL